MRRRRRGSQRRGPQLDRRSWTDEACDRLAHLYSVEGLRFDEIAPHLNKTPAAVRTQARLLGLTLTPQARALRRVRHRAMKGLSPMTIWKPMTNSELLAYTGPDDQLGGLERQRRYVLRIETTQRPCPNCGTMQSKLEAHGVALDDWDAHAHYGDRVHCVGCQRELDYTVPLFGGDIHWSLVAVKAEADGRA